MLVKFNPSVPSPDPVLAVTVQIAPLPVTPVTAGVPPSPVFTTAKLPEATPLTLSLNVTVHWTLKAFVGEEVTRLIEVTVGAVRSMVYT
jgi:hypothetical protein